MATSITFLATKLVESLSSDTGSGLGQVSSLASGTLRIAASLLNRAADKLSADSNKDDTDYKSKDVVDYRLVLSDNQAQKKCSQSISIGSVLKPVYSRISDDLMYDDDEDEDGLTDTTNYSVLSIDSGLGDLQVAEKDHELTENETEDDDFGNPQGLKEISLDEVSDHCYEDDAWMVIYNKVYDVTDFIIQHPGGDSVLLENIGYDGTMAFHGVGHSRDALEMLDDYLIGILPPSQRIRSYIPNTPHSVPGCW